MSMTPQDANSINELVSDEVKRLMHRFGNLFVHISGEGKVDFRSAMGNSNGWLGMLKTIISGDMGCMTPYPGYDTCALDAALDYLFGLDLVPHLNSSINEEYVPATEEWHKFINDIKEELKNLPSDKYKTKYVYKFTGGDDDKTIVTVTIEPLCNTFVIGEYNASNKHEYLGVIDDYDQPKIKECIITINGEDIEIELTRLIHFRHRLYEPRKGDYLLFDEENNVYIVLPQEDYHIH